MNFLPYLKETKFATHQVLWILLIGHYFFYLLKFKIQIDVKNGEEGGH
jgi:hypothetical protein